MTNKSAPKEVKTHKVLQKHFDQAEFANARFSVKIPSADHFADLLKPEAWAQVSHILAKQPYTREPAKVGTIIEVRTDDQTMYAELYVRAVLEQGLIVATIREPIVFDDGRGIADKDFEYRFNKSSATWDVVRKSDNAIVGQNFPVRESAVQHIAKMKAA